MVVRRLLSVPNWEPAERKLTKGGRLLIPRGMHFDSGLFPELVIPHNHTGPLVDSAMWQEVPCHTVGPFWAVDSIFPSPPGDLTLFTAKEVAKLKELGVLNPPNVPGHLPLFPLLVSSSWGKVVSTVLGTPPPNLDAHGLEQSLATDKTRTPSSPTVTQTVTPTPWTAAPCRAGIPCVAQKGNRNHGQLSARTEMAISLVTRIATELWQGTW